MAEVKVEALVDHLSSEFRKALADTISEVAPNARVDEYEAFRVFKRAVYRKCRVWERVPDQIVKS